MESDMYTSLAAECYNIPISEVTPKHRQAIKSIAFYWIYASPRRQTLRQYLGLSERSNYFNTKNISSTI